MEDNSTWTLEVPIFTSELVDKWIDGLSAIDEEMVAVSNLLHPGDPQQWEMSVTALIDQARELLIIRRNILKDAGR